MKKLTSVKQLNDPENVCYKRGTKYKQGCRYSDNIYTFDIEVTSLFNINNNWQPFDYSIDDYTSIEHASCVYISMFGINDNVYYFRDFSMFEQILKTISDSFVRKIIYVHNLAYEMNFMRMFLHKYTIENVLASAPHKPICFYIKELNIEFRCSYRLTNLSLAKSAEKYTTVKKKTGDLDYNLPYSPLSKLDKKALGYCEYDIICLYEIIKYFRSEYEHVYNIPYTQTGEVRRDLKNRLDYFYFKKQQAFIPDYEIYLYLMQAFQGGITHANMIYSNTVLNNVYSADETSAYPTMMLTKKFPCGKWTDYDIQDYERMKNFKAFMFHVKLKNVKSKLYNHYLSSYKCLSKVNLFSDNGRIIKADEIEIVVTDCDYEMIKQSYAYTDIEYIRILGCNKYYLDRRILQYILDLYKQKTELKGVAGQEEYYMKAKQRVNSLFGCSVTSVFNQDTYFKNNKWGRYCNPDTEDEEERQAIKEKFINDKLDELRNGTNYFQYACGVWVTAYNRQALWSQIVENDSIVCYYDTDSIKSVKPIDFSKYNEQIIKECEQSAIENGLDIDDFAPADIKGIKHPLGIFDIEKTSKTFITLGAKKYCCDYGDGLHLTVSGVPKSAVSALNNDITNFKHGFVFDYASANKNIHFYTEQTPFTFTDTDGNNYTCTDTYGIVLQPTTYKLGITEEYEKVLEEYGNNGE